jgi:serralysin
MAKLSRRSMVVASALGLVAGQTRAQSLPQAVAHTTFKKTTIQVRPYAGRNVVVMVDPARSTDPGVIQRIVTSIDRAWDWYRAHLGVLPQPWNLYQGKLATVAENAQDAAAFARGWLSYTGIEIGTSSMSRLLLEANLDRYNQAVFYELGRNFWRFDEQLGAMAKEANGGVFTTGFAHVHRFYSMEASGIVGAPWDDTLDFDAFKHSILVEMLDRYLADSSLNWENTLAANRAPVNPYGWTADHLAAAMFHRIRRDHGYAGARRFWQLMSKAPKAATAREAAANFVRVAAAATGQDYRELMRDRKLPT